MDTSQDKILEILRKAIEVEKNGLKTYLQFARETKDLSGKDMFILLANDEFDHMNLLEDMVKEYLHMEDVALPETVDLSEIEKIVPKIRKKDLATVGKAGADELVALKMARDMEKNAIAYYERLYELVSDEKMRKLVRRLVEMEEGHYNIIQMQIDSITNSGFWFDIMEFSVEM
jgi:rubrerythrin